MVPHVLGVGNAMEEDYWLALAAGYVVPVDDVVVAGRGDKVVGEGRTV